MAKKQQKPPKPDQPKHTPPDKRDKYKARPSTDSKPTKKAVPDPIPIDIQEMKKRAPRK